MNWIATHPWLIPLLPLTSAGIIAISGRPCRRRAATLAIGSMGLGFLLSLAALIATFGADGHRIVSNHAWFTAGQLVVPAGWIVDPLSASMLVMITFVGSLIFIFSTGYMSEDPNFTRFFGFLSLFAAAMLGLVIANSLLVLFVCWELVGVASYLLIGFWFTKPSAAAAAKKAFLTTRIGDLGLFTALLWLNAGTGSLLFFDGGRGLLEPSSLTPLAATTTVGGLAASGAIALLCLWGAAGKSGQLPLHVWLPDAMEGPTPVSALIHAATMVAAGVFLAARLHPLFSAAGGPDGLEFRSDTPALVVMAWVGALTAVFAATCAMAQSDLKRILAYSTVSQLGLMFVGVATGGPAVGMLHLLTHAFFKALLFLGAGSIIHACHHEQDIRRMGGLRRHLPLTFATYGIGMMALSGVPIFFSGFWSKDAILHGAQSWPVSKGPFVLCLVGAALTAFYMTRQICFVFLGKPRAETQPEMHETHGAQSESSGSAPHESPAVMTVPLAILAAWTLMLSAVCTPFWPLLEHYLAGTEPHAESAMEGVWGLLLISTFVSFAGIALGWTTYRSVRTTGIADDPLEIRFPRFHHWLNRGYAIDALYAATITRAGWGIGQAVAWLERWIWDGLVDLVQTLGHIGGWAGSRLDEQALNDGFDAGCDTTRSTGQSASRFHNGRAHRYLRWVAIGTAALALLLIWIA